MKKTTYSLPFLTAAALFSSSPVPAAILDFVPMQGTMVHMNVGFRNSPTDTLSVVVDPTPVTLTPLVVSNPVDTFDPMAPWYQPLQGASFTRRYGFVVAAGTDTLPYNCSIWVRWIESSPGLKIYNYRKSGVFSPSFGTDGSDAVWRWDLIMYHPVFVAPASTNGHYARFEVFVADTNTATAVEGYTTATFRIDLANLPEPTPPALIISRTNGALQIQWPLSPPGFALESTQLLPPRGEWLTVTNPIGTNGTSGVLVLPGDLQTLFFRLKKSGSY